MALAEIFLSEKDADKYEEDLRIKLTDSFTEFMSAVELAVSKNGQLILLDQQQLQETLVSQLELMKEKLKDYPIFHRRKSQLDADRLERLRDQRRRAAQTLAEAEQVSQGISTPAKDRRSVVLPASVLSGLPSAKDREKKPSAVPATSREPSSSSPGPTRKKDKKKGSKTERTSSHTKDSAGIRVGGTDAAADVEEKMVRAKAGVLQLTGEMRTRVRAFEGQFGAVDVGIGQAKVLKAVNEAIRQIAPIITFGNYSYTTPAAGMDATITIAYVKRKETEICMALLRDVENQANNIQEVASLIVILRILREAHGLLVK